MPSVAIEQPRADCSNASSGTSPDPSGTPADLSDPDEPTADCRLLALRLLAKPVRLKSLSASRPGLPADVTDLVRQIEDITLFNEAFVPAAARQMILKEVPGGARWPDFFFQPSAATRPAPANGRSRGLGPWTEETGGAGESQQVLAQREFHALATIVDDARECSTRFWGELAWKKLVHWPILSLAARASGGRIVCETTMAASIETQWLPQRPPAVGSSASGGNTAG